MKEQYCRLNIDIELIMESENFLESNGIHLHLYQWKIVVISRKTGFSSPAVQYFTSFNGFCRQNAANLKNPFFSSQGE